MAVTLDLYRGDCLPVPLELLDDAGPLDLTGWSSVTLKVVWGCTEVEITPTVNEPVGEISGTFTGSQTAGFPIGTKAKLFLTRVMNGCRKSYLIARLRVKKSDD
jgi:hypothetical protein